MRSVKKEDLTIREMLPEHKMVLKIETSMFLVFIWLRHHSPGVRVLGFGCLIFVK